MMHTEQLLSNFIGGVAKTSSTTRTLPVINPATGEEIATVPLSTEVELNEAVEIAYKAQKEWAAIPVKERVQVLFRLKILVEENLDSLMELVSIENGKTVEEARGSVQRAIECIEFACSLPQIGTGETLEVSRGVDCMTRRFPLGVVGLITPFNFPFMVPFWMAPTALACGNAIVLKPSEQTPLSANRIAGLFNEAGLPKGLFNVIHGDRAIVEGLCDHSKVRALGFVGSTHVAHAVYARASIAGKRVRALGGAKNHLILIPDADPEMAASNIVASATGCAGQRCMAASVLLAVGPVDAILQRIHDKMAALTPGKDLGPVISQEALERIHGYLARAETQGARLTLDGRSRSCDKGFFVGASIIDYATPEHEAAREEIFGPVLTIIRCESLDEALEIENSNPYGNAAAIYTSSGRIAQEFTERAQAGMIGINIGVPVPREPFAFGGWHQSRFGDGDLTGMAGLDFWTQNKKVTTKWSAHNKANWMS